MSNRIILLVSAIGLLLLMVIGGAVLSTKSNNAATTSTRTPTPVFSDAPQVDNSISISGYAFAPATITMKKGTVVTWTNHDTVSHTITADTASDTAPSSALVGNGQTFSFTFTKAGTYSYHCQPHPDMKGVVIVTE
jgi:plastocyanin